MACSAGGYIGVDVFFVISGFLITTIIVREIAAQNFSIASFYERRVRRILPAIMAVVIFCLVVGSLLLETGDFENLARSSIANNLFPSNIYFYFQTGYFDAPAELKPLLHTWSLSVEEQYYLIFPLLLLLIARYCSRKYLHFLLPLLLLWFAACVHGMSQDPSAVFYFLPTRGWELLIGSVLAIAAIPPLLNTIGRNALALLGLALIVYSVAAFNDDTLFPGSIAAIPTIGSALVIYAGASGATLVSRLLSIRPMVFIGLISYSLYLWHWPLIAFAKYYKAVDLSRLEELQLLLVIFMAAVLSWRFIETPFRRKRLLAARKPLFVASLTATALLIAAELSFTLTGDDAEWKHWEECKERLVDPADLDSLCSIGADNGEPRFLFWGDSHARTLAPGVNASAIRHGAAGVFATNTACPPLWNIDRPGRTDCHEFNVAVLDYVSRHAAIDTVVIAACWTLSVRGTRYKDEDGDLVEVVDITAPAGDPRTSRELFEAGLRGTVSALRDLGKRVVIVGPVPEIGYSVPATNHIAKITGRDVNEMIAPSIEEFRERNSEILEVIKRLEDEGAVEVVRPAGIIVQ
ncbi:MAG: acyltransferase family protein [Proteobacteria bacterium]|nr:acyltransferase family protein [Pseudomonadota bacterium]